MTGKEITNRACELIDQCPFVTDTLGAFPKTIEKLKMAFCLKDYEICARYQLNQAKLPVPVDLFPSEHARAAEIIARSSKTK